MGDNPYSWGDPVPQYRRRKTQNEIEQEKARLLEQEFKEEMRAKGRVDILRDDAEGYAAAYENWQWWRAKKRSGR